MRDRKTDENGKTLLIFLLQSSLININVGPTTFMNNSEIAPHKIPLSPTISNKLITK